MAPDAPPVTLYTLPGCLLCRRLRAFLRRHRVAFHEVNVLTRPKSLAKVVLGYRKVLPITVVDGRVISGWSRRKLTAALHLRRSSSSSARSNRLRLKPRLTVRSGRR
jgi:glutaredoxin